MPRGGIAPHARWWPPCLDEASLPQVDAPRRPSAQRQSTDNGNTQQVNTASRRSMPHGGRAPRVVRIVFGLRALRLLRLLRLTIAGARRTHASPPTHLRPHAPTQPPLRVLRLTIAGARRTHAPPPTRLDRAAPCPSTTWQLFTPRAAMLRPARCNPYSHTPRRRAVHAHTPPRIEPPRTDRAPPQTRWRRNWCGWRRSSAGCSPASSRYSPSTLRSESSSSAAGAPRRGAARPGVAWCAQAWRGAPRRGVVRPGAWCSRRRGVRRERRGVRLEAPAWGATGIAAPVFARAHALGAGQVRIQNTEYRTQNTEHRTQNTEHNRRLSL
jgi:hypothetical protein